MYDNAQVLMSAQVTVTDAVASGGNHPVAFHKDGDDVCRTCYCP